MKVDPAWAHRRLLLRAGNELGPKSLARLRTVFDTDDPTNEISAAWGVKELLAQMLRAHGPNGYSRHETSLRRTRFLAKRPVSWGRSRSGGQRSKGSWNSATRTPGPRATTASSSKSSASPAGSVIRTTTKGASCCIAQPTGPRELPAVEANPA